MFYRALHMISTSRCRPPARRYDFDLFDIDLDGDVLSQLDESLNPPPVPSLRGSTSATELSRRERAVRRTSSARATKRTECPPFLSTHL